MHIDLTFYTGFVPRIWFKVSVSAAGQKKRPVKSKKKLIVHRGARRERWERKFKIISAYSAVCGEILLGMASNFMKFHMSPAAGLKSGQSDRKRNYANGKSSANQNAELAEAFLNKKHRFLWFVKKS
jgi:hypothetical protein